MQGGRDGRDSRGQSELVLHLVGRNGHWGRREGRIVEHAGRQLPVVLLRAGAGTVLVFLGGGNDGLHHGSLGQGNHGGVQLCVAGSLQVGQVLLKQTSASLQVLTHQVVNESGHSHKVLALGVSRVDAELDAVLGRSAQTSATHHGGHVVAVEPWETAPVHTAYNLDKRST